VVVVIVAGLEWLVNDDDGEPRFEEEKGDDFFFLGERTPFVRRDGDDGAGGHAGWNVPRAVSTNKSL